MAEDGASGHLRRDPNTGALTCVADKHDARTLDQRMRDHDRIMQDQYAQYARQQADAYRTLDARRVQSNNANGTKSTLYVDRAHEDFLNNSWKCGK